MTVPKTLQMLAPAKLNLFLHITGKREDGYHTLQSGMVFLDIGDMLEMTANDDFSVEVKGPYASQLGDVRDNLIYKAADMLAAQFRVPLRGKITLTKNLPVAAGLGGGSTDAATTLRGLSTLWELPKKPEILFSLAQILGADVPACLFRKPVWAEGIGEKMEPLKPLPPLFFVLVNPRTITPTPEVFKRYEGPYSTPLPFNGELPNLHSCRNDLTDAAVTVSPEINEVLAALNKTNCIFSRLSGSGATCFGIYKDKDAAIRTVRELKATHRDWWITNAGLVKQAIE